MAFSFFFGFIAFWVQLYVLCAYADRFRKLPCLSLLLMEVLPLGGAVYYAVRRPEVPYLGWRFGEAVCLWIAGGILLGCLLAWGAYAISRRR